MKIRDIQIDGFGVWSGLSVDSLPQDMVVFYGPNEAGKTTLMQFLRAMFYGFTPQRRLRYLPPVHGGKPGGLMRVTGPGGGYEVSRRASLDAETTAGQLTVTSGDGVSQGQHRLATLLGNVDESIFTNVFAIGLRELQELNTLDDTAAADELYKLSSGLDRVSLVDVIRKLKTARSQIISADGERGQMPAIMLRREKLREELERLNDRSRRWGELAAIRRSQQKEVAELRGRVETLSLESRTIELAIQAREPWRQRDDLRRQIESLAARLDIPDDALPKIEALHREVDEKREAIDKLRQGRRELRAAADSLPLNKAVLKLATRIDVANEQGPWIAALQKQIQQLNTQVDKSREQLIADAQRLSLSEEDQQALLNDRRVGSLPELSRQAIGQLAGPAKDVRTHLTNLRQAKERIRNDRREYEKLGEKLQAALRVRNQPDLHTALAHQQSLIANLRKLQQIDERLDKLLRHRKELESDAVELAAQEALPVDRAVMLGFAFVPGVAMLGIAALKGLGIGFTALSSTATAFMLVAGIVLLMVWSLMQQLDQKTTGNDLADTESQLEGLIAQIRKTQAERDEMLKLVPEHGSAPESRIREAEGELQTLETLLPTSHNLEAVQQRLKATTSDARAASDGLRSSRNQWKRTLHSLGLAESLSPKSLRMMAEGYESLVQSRRRLKAQEDELDQRRIELAAIDAKVDALLRQVSATGVAAKPSAEPSRASQHEPAFDAPRGVPKSVQQGGQQRSDSRSDNRQRPAGRDEPAAAAEPAEPNRTTEKLAQLQSIIAGQQQHIARRRELREQFETLAKKYKTLRKGVDRLLRTRDALLAELAVEDADQLRELVARKTQHEKLSTQAEDRQGRVAAIVGGQVPYEAVARLLDNTQAATELEKRWEQVTQHIQQAESRVSSLLEKQGETQQEMKTIAGDRRLLEIKTELSVLDRQLELTAEHWRTLATTSVMLQRVCEVYETERQPETLREASAFLKQLTDGKYRRVWTPLGKNALRVENDRGQDLPLEVLSRGTREAVFIALRLSLAAAYSRRGVTLPLILDDVLVNFDTERACCAARVLQDFSQLGHQTVFFTCHEHVMRMFHDIGVQVRVLPAQGQSGEAAVYVPPAQALVVESAAPAAEAATLQPTMPLPTMPLPALPQPVVEPVAAEPPQPAAAELPDDSDALDLSDTSDLSDDLDQADPTDLDLSDLPEADAVSDDAEDPVDEAEAEPVEAADEPEPAPPPRPRKVRSQPRPKRRPAHAEQPVEAADEMGRLWYEADVETPSAWYAPPADPQASDELDAATWLDGRNLAPVAWDWDTLAIESVPSADAREERS